MAMAVITGAVTAGAASIRYPVKQPYCLSEIKNVLHFTITLLNLQIIRPDRDTCTPLTRNGDLTLNPTPN